MSVRKYVLLVSLLVLVLAVALPAQAQRLVIANIGDVVKLDPAYVTDVQSSTVSNQIHERLAVYDESGEPQPALAVSWEASEGGQVWTFYLREGVTFHDGTPFNAEAVKYTFERLRDPEMASPGAGDISIVDTITVIDDFTVQFTLERPSAAFLSTSIMATRSAIVSPAAAEEYGQDLSNHPVGTGPFKFVEWQPDSHVLLQANVDYWGGAPLLSEVMFKPIPEATTQLVELETQGVDFILRVGSTDFNRIQDNPDLQIFSTPDFNARYIFFQNQKFPFEDKNIRYAVSHAIPVDDIVTAFLQNVAVRIHGVMPESSWAAHTPSKLFDYDVDKAKEYLAASGWTETNSQGYLEQDGVELSVEIYTPDGRYPMDKEMATVIQQSLGDIGIRGEIKVLEWGAYLAAVDDGEHQLCILGWSQSSGEPATMYGPQFKSHAIGGWANAMFYHSDAVDALLLQGEEETDMEARIAIYQEVQEIIAVDAPMIPMYSEYLTYAAQNHVQGYNHSPAGFDLTTVYLDK